MLERRVWVTTANMPLYPNLFTLLVSPPGIGKTAVLSQIVGFLRECDHLHIAPDNMTKPALLDVLQAAETRRFDDMGMPIISHTLQIIAPEFGVFCPAHDLEFLSVLCALYDCGTNFKEHRRHLKDKQINLPNPHITLLGGTQPGYLSSLLPPAAWEQGFMSRIIMVYSDQYMRVKLFDAVPLREDLRKSLILHARRIAEISGYIEWTPEAKQIMVAWHEADGPPTPSHFKLKNYNSRRTIHAIKLSMISALSRNRSMIEQSDVARGIQWLTDTEAFMPEIFKAMAGNSDHDILRELQIYLTGEYLRKSKPIHEQFLISFLQSRTPVGNIMRILEVAERSGLIAREAGTQTYMPGPGSLDPQT